MQNENQIAAVENIENINAMMDITAEEATVMTAIGEVLDADILVMHPHDYQIEMISGVGMANLINSGSSEGERILGNMIAETGLFVSMIHNFQRMIDSFLEAIRNGQDAVELLPSVCQEMELEVGTMLNLKVSVDALVLAKAAFVAARREAFPT